MTLKTAWKSNSYKRKKKNPIKHVSFDLYAEQKKN